MSDESLILGGKRHRSVEIATSMIESGNLVLIAIAKI